MSNLPAFVANFWLHFPFSALHTRGDFHILSTSHLYIYLAPLHLEPTDRPIAASPEPIPPIVLPTKMRLPLERLLVLLFLFLSPAAAVGASCFKVVSALVGRPGHLFNKFQSEICDRGCQPTIPHWDLWTRNNTFVPAVRSLMQRMNVPHQEEQLLKMGDDVAVIIKDQCAPLLRGRHICSDPNTLADFGNCFKRNFLKASIKHLPILLPMASEAACKEQLRFLQGDELWEQTIPQNMRDYASVCDKLGPFEHDEL